MKYGRTYSLIVQGELTEHEIDFPLTVDFDIERNTLASANTGRFTIKNLAQTTRRDIFHDRYDTLNYKFIQFTAGYKKESFTPTLFRGNIRVAESFRQGTDWITNIEAWDGGYGILNSQASGSFPAGTDKNTLINALIGSMKSLTVGAVGTFPSPASQRGTVLMGNSWDLVQQLTPGAQPFIDNEKVYVIQKNDYLAGVEIFDLSAQSGLIATPRRRDATLVATMLFEPKIQVGQLVQLTSLEPINNGLYVILGIKHRGTISGGVCGQAYTELLLNAGTQKLNGVHSL